MRLQCTQCGGEFERPRRRRFCSTHCFHAWSKGRINKGPKSLEMWMKLSRSTKGVSKGSFSADHRKNMSNARKGMKFTEAHRRALSEAKVRFLESGGFHGRQCEYVSSKTGKKNWAHSGFELELMRQLDASDDVMHWTKNHGIRIPYVHGSRRTYVPDFRVDVRDGLVIVMEAKGYEFEPERCAAKARAAHDFCQSRGWIYQVISQKFGVQEA